MVTFQVLGLRSFFLMMNFESNTCNFSPHVYYVHLPGAIFHRSILDQATILFMN